MRDEETRYKKKVAKKPFGIESWNDSLQRWGNRSWYATNRARDQALVDLQKRCEAVKLVALLRRIER